MIHHGAHAAAEPTRVSYFAVPGMRCAGCIAKLEKGLARVPGIATARVNFTAKQLAICHQPALTILDMLDAIAGVGFEAQPLDNTCVSRATQESHQLLLAMAVAGFAMMNIMLLSVSVWSGALGPTREMFHWLSALIAMPAVAYAGQPFFRSALTALKNRRTNMDVPISIGVFLATGMSLFEAITGGPHAYFDGAVMLLFFLLTGRWLDSVMRDRARNGVAALVKNRAAGALIIDDTGRSHWVAADKLAASQTMLVAAGERLAADGVITKGTSRFDVSLLTGESAPVTAAVGETVYAGTLNLDGPVEVRITAAVNNTALADIARLMEQAAQSKSRYVRIADRAARLYAPAVHTLALASFAGWMIAGAGWHQALMIAVAVLIITCPCALGLAVPAAQIVAAGALMKKGILVKDGSALERLADVDVALFDKTGTLTLGRPVPLTLDHLSQTEKQVLLALARASRHPLSEAARKALEADGTMAAVIDSVVDHPGIGMTGVYDGVSVTLSRPDSQTGNASLAVQLQLGEAPGTVIRFEDQIRPGARETLAALKSMGISSSIISGDRAEAVLPVAAALGLAARSSLHPVEKLAAIDCLTQGGAKILMVGDGLNDGPALAAGHASMAPASASDAGQNAADLVFMGDSLAPVATAVSIARATQHIVRQNFAAAIAYNMIAVPLAVAGFVTPLIAALAMSGSSILVVANALRLRKAAR